MIILRNLVQDILWALLALGAAVYLLVPAQAAVSGGDLFLQKTGTFLLVTVLPSVIVWSVFATRGRRCGVIAALFYQLLATAISLLLLYSLSASSGLGDGEARMVLLGFAVFSGIKILEFAVQKCRVLIPGVVQRVLVVGSGPLADKMGDLAAASGGRYVFLGRVDCPAPCGRPGEEESAESRAGRLLRVAQNFMADKLVVSLAERRGFFPVEEMLSCKLSGIEVLDAPSFYEKATQKLLIENITPSWFIFSHGFKVTWLLRLCKRSIDIAASLFGLLCFVPILPFLILAIKIDSPGPILFRQVRVGRGDRPFTLMKFRSMRQDAESGTGAVWATVNDNRITRFGNFLRKTRLDEIPQLLNILRGDMSLVGPRPERPEFVSKLKERIPYYSERHYVKPGLTGWAQVCYPYGASVEDAIEKLRYDLYYIKNISFMLDLRIIARTFGVVLLGKGR